MDLGISGKRALVVGASSGLGAAVARVLAEEGATVFAAARRVEKIAAGPVGSGEVRARRLDIGDVAEVEALAAELLPGGVDILVNNCGGPPPGSALETTRDAWSAQFAPMAANIFHLTALLLPPMLARRWGRVITIGSSGIEQPLPRLVISNGLRAAVAGWSKTLASEVAAQGVTVNMVLPGRIRTERTAQIDGAAAARAGGSVAEVEAHSAAQIPAGRYGEAREFANVVAFLAGTPSSYVTGSMVRVDGGLIRGV